MLLVLGCIIGGLIGYIIGITIWDKIIVPILEKRRYDKERRIFLEHIKLCKIIGGK